MAGFSATALLTRALCVGANPAIFVVVDSKREFRLTDVQRSVIGDILA